jgi:phenylacetate-CoA ligase
MPIEKQAEVLRACNSYYLLTYPNNAVRLADYFRRNDLRLPGLREVMTYGESIFPETRETCREAWGVSVSDMYSCEEVGYIALQCPKDVHNYHCQSEVLVEVIDDEGRPCVAGQIGRVVLTVLHNFAMPLIRYENEDYAEVGGPCACGRGLPVIRRILGRKRNMARAADGSRFWTELSPAIWSSIGQIDELQLIQDQLDHIELRIVSRQPLDEDQERSLTAGLSRALGQPYRFSVRYHQENLRYANGKFERFICQVTVKPASV